MRINLKTANPAIKSDVQKRRFALLLPAGYGKRYAATTPSAVTNG